MVKMVNYNKNTIFEKILLDLEITGHISVSWITKESRRIEIVTKKVDDDSYDEQIKETEEKNYEASFPGTENGI